MEQGEWIDNIHGDLYRLAVSEAKYGFVSFAVPWGRKRTDEYNRKLLKFKGAIRQFAKDCPVKAYADKLYYFNGKVYEAVTQTVVYQAFDLLMESLGIAEMAMNKSFCKEVFVSTILAYNQLHFRNDVVAFRNGVVDFSEGYDNLKLHRFGPQWHVLDYHPYRYDPQAKAPLFKRFIEEVLPDKCQRDILQMFLGLGVIQTSEAFDKTTARPRGTVELCLILLGGGSNGKSVLFNIICALFGKTHITSVDYDTMTADGDEGLRGRATIRSAVFNWSSDSDPRRFGKKNNAIFKQIVSGEEYTYRLLGRDIERSKTCPYLIFSFNELPTVSETTRGFLRRLQFISFTTTIPRSKQNPNLASDIIDKDMSGIFNWVLRGAREIKRRRFCFPSTEASVKSKILSILPTNPVAAWMWAYSLRAEGLNPTELSTNIRSVSLQRSFSLFAADNGVSVEMSERKFGDVLYSLGFQKVRKAEGVCYVCYGALEEDLFKPIIISSLTSDKHESIWTDDENSLIKDD